MLRTHRAAARLLPLPCVPSPCCSGKPHASSLHLSKAYPMVAAPSQPEPCLCNQMKSNYTVLYPSGCQAQGHRQQTRSLLHLGNNLPASASMPDSSAAARSYHLVGSRTRLASTSSSKGISSHGSRYNADAAMFKEKPPGAAQLQAAPRTVLLASSLQTNASKSINCAPAQVPILISRHSSYPRSLLIC